jgi:hypothetical protein
VTNLQRLVAAARQAPGAPDAKLPTFVVEDDAAADDALDALMAYFGEDRSRAAVRLVVGAEEVGYVPREALYERAIVIDRGFGGGAGASLPGAPFGGSAHAGVPGSPTGGGGLLALHCPVPGCPAPPVLAMRYDEDYPPHCTVHPDTALVLDDA